MPRHSVEPYARSVLFLEKPINTLYAWLQEAAGYWRPPAYCYFIKSAMSASGVLMGAMAY